MTRSGHPVVSVWKRSWLPGSETFIRAQQDGLARWRAESVGWERLPGGLGRPEDVILGSGRLWRLKAALLALTGWSPQLSRHWEQSDPDLVHVHFLTQAKGVAALARRRGIPVVITAHGNDVTEAPSKPGLRGAVYRWQARRILRSAAAVVAVSEFVAERLRSLGTKEESLHVIPVGVEIAPPSPVGPSYDIAFVGRLVDVKGARDLLEAADKLASRGRPVSVVMAGDGPMRSELEDFARERALDVTFLGHVPHDRVADVMASGHVFCGPSKATGSGAVEGLGLVFLEAAVQKRPVVAYRSGGVGEAVVHGVTGYLAEEGDTVALADALQLLLDDPERARNMGEVGREAVMASFDRRSCTTRLEALYNSLLETA